MVFICYSAYLSLLIQLSFLNQTTFFFLVEKDSRNLKIFLHCFITFTTFDIWCHAISNQKHLKKENKKIDYKRTVFTSIRANASSFHVRDFYSHIR